MRDRSRNVEDRRGAAADHGGDGDVMRDRSRNVEDVLPPGTRLKTARGAMR